MNYNRRFRRSGACAKVVRRIGFCLFLAVLFLANPYLASADHSLGNTCNICHSLRAQSVLSSSSNLISFSGSPANTELYTARWYCDGTDTYDPLGANSWSLGQPPHCTLCHDSGNIYVEMDPSTESLHPVFTDGPTWAQFTTKFGATPHRIYCQDCHNSEVLPADITDTENVCESGGDGGHPNHQNMSVVAQATGTNNRLFDETHLDLALRARGMGAWRVDGREGGEGGRARGGANEVPA